MALYTLMGYIARGILKNVTKAVVSLTILLGTLRGKKKYDMLESERGSVK